jgi:WD40 repeat protein
MFLQSRTLHKENDLLQAENVRLAQYIELAQQRVQELSGSLQKRHLNVMPAISVSDDVTRPPRSTHTPSWFARAGSVQLQSPVLTLSDGAFLAAGESSGSISLLQTGGSTDSPGLYRFPAEPSTGALSLAPQQSLAGHTGAVMSLKWHNNSELSSVALDGSLRLWNVDRGACASQHDLGVPSVSHALLDGAILAATCTKSPVAVDLRDPKPTILTLDTPVSSVASTQLGLLLGTTTGDVLLFDMRTVRAYQSVHICPTKLPISRISGFETVTITSFDGYVRTLGSALPLYVERESRHAPMTGSFIGSCALPMLSRNDFIISGSIGGNAIMWTSLGDSVHLKHRGSIVADCVPLAGYVGAFATCDSAGIVGMWARCFDDGR